MTARLAPQRLRPQHRNQLREVFEAIRDLTMPPGPPKRLIGFVTQEDKRTLKASTAIKGKKAP